MGGCEGSFCRLFGNFAESLAYSKSTFKCVLLYPLLSRFSTSEFFRANRNVMRNRPVEKELRDLFPLSTSILIRLADVISDTDKGKRSFRARKFASGKPTLSPLLLNSNKQQQQQQQQPNKFNSLFMISTILCFWTERSDVLYSKEFALLTLLHVWINEPIPSRIDVHILCGVRPRNYLNDFVFSVCKMK